MYLSTRELVYLIFKKIKQDSDAPVPSSSTTSGHSEALVNSAGSLSQMKLSFTHEKRLELRKPVEQV